MSGEQQSGHKTVDDRRKNVEEEINKLLERLGIPVDCPNAPLAKEYLSATRDEINSLSKSECLNRAFVLGQHSMNIQLQYNIESARVKWANTMLGKIASREDDGKSNKFVNFEEKKLKAAINDSAASRLLDIKIYSESRMTYLEFISSSINNMVNTLKELAKIKEHSNA